MRITLCLYVRKVLDSKEEGRREERNGGCKLHVRKERRGRITRLWVHMNMLCTIVARLSSFYYLQKPTNKRVNFNIQGHTLF